MNCINCLGDFLSETDSISMLPISNYAWTEQPFMQLVSTFTDVYYKNVSAQLDQIVIWDLMRGILKKTR